MNWNPAAEKVLPASRTRGSRRASGLYFYGYRYLDTQLGRWLSRDPIGESGESNLYVFVGNSGVDQRDAFGLESHLTRQKRLKREAEEKEAAERRKPPVINPYQGPKELLVVKNQVAAARDFFGHVMALEAIRLTLGGNSQSEYGGAICEKCVKCDDGSERSHVIVTGPGGGGARSYSIILNWTTLPDETRNYSEICPPGYDAIGQYHSHLFTSAGASANPSEADRTRFKQDDKERARLSQNYTDNNKFVDNIVCGIQFADGNDPEFVGGVQNAGRPPGVWTINRRLNEPFSDKTPQQPQNNPCP